MSTRIRAIPSTLSAKASPLVPPPSKAFDPAVKAVLRHRLTYNIFLSSLAFAWVQVVVLYIWTLGGLQNIGLQGLISMPFNLPVILVAVLGWFTTAVPVLVLRKSCLTGESTRPILIFFAKYVYSTPARPDFSFENPTSRASTE